MNLYFLENWLLSMKKLVYASAAAILSTTQLHADSNSEFAKLYNMKQCQSSMTKSSLYDTGDFFIMQSRLENPFELASWDGYKGIVQNFDFLVLNYDFKKNEINDWLLFGMDSKTYVDFSYISQAPQGLIEDNNVIDSIAIDAKYDELEIAHINDDFGTIYSCEIVSDGQTSHGNFVHFIEYIESNFPNAK